ncbi:putative umta methyltransferase family protein [Botrytis fragariae]|uniref:Putative umta methyltransferase family protein n=1 Tax=Botrytis fragariae TaxID=1964551 RepID=A0A8H6AXF7_9HELO|nr:putative umta methyltransferase family protein [Botrytis fragariae]KAF5875170.1 putative umta methyltransferase family protein [Botrytis fragariae]
MASKAEPPQDKQEPNNDHEYIIQRDYKSHMRILTHQPNLRIADVGTGTGTTLPIQSPQYEPATYPATLPPPSKSTSSTSPPRILRAGFPSAKCTLVHLYTHDGFQDYASEFHEQYDIVHARFWLCVVNDPDARPLLRKLLSLLKPGGYLQWIEPLPLAAEEVVMQEGTVTVTASERLCNTFHKSKPDRLVDVSRTEHTWPNYLRPLWSQSSMAATADVMAKIDVYNTEGREMRMKFVEALERESANGVAVDTPFQCVVGRKIL